MPPDAGVSTSTDSKPRAHSGVSSSTHAALSMQRNIRGNLSGVVCGDSSPADMTRMFCRAPATGLGAYAHLVLLNPLILQDGIRVAPAFIFNARPRYTHARCRFHGAARVRAQRGRAVLGEAPPAHRALGARAAGRDRPAFARGAAAAARGAACAQPAAPRALVQRQP